MRKTGKLILGILCAALLAVSCAQQSAQTDVNALADELAQKVSYGEELTKLEPDAIERVYKIDPDLVTSAAAYVGSGATVDEAAVWEATDDAAAQSIEETLAQRIATRIADYADYKPDEVPKLENAVLTRSGRYVALCVTADTNTAQQVIDDTLKG